MAGGDYISIDGKKIKVLSIRNPQELPWDDLKVDIAISYLIFCPVFGGNYIW